MHSDDADERGENKTGVNVSLSSVNSNPATKSISQ